MQVWFEQRETAPYLFYYFNLSNSKFAVKATHMCDFLTDGLHKEIQLH